MSLQDSIADRAAATMNHISEGTTEIVTREQAIEAATYLCDECERLNLAIAKLRMAVVHRATELVREVTP